MYRAAGNKQPVVTLTLWKSCLRNATYFLLNNYYYVHTVYYMEIYELYEFHCKLAEHKILILKKKQRFKETMYAT